MNTKASYIYIVCYKLYKDLFLKYLQRNPVALYMIVYSLQPTRWSQIYLDEYLHWFFAMELYEYMEKVWK